MKYLLAAVVAFMTIAATTSMIDNGWPPEKYMADRGVSVLFVTDIHKLCGKDPPNATLMACAMGNTIVMPNPNTHPEYRGEKFARIMGHEIGHTNGWPGDHPRP